MQNSIEAKFGFIQSQIKLLKDGFNRTFSQKLELFQNNIDSLKQNYIMNNPEKKRTNWICSNFEKIIK